MLNFKLLAKTYELYVQEVKWCGRIIVGKGLKMNPKNYQGLAELETAIKENDLQHFLCF